MNLRLRISILSISSVLLVSIGLLASSEMSSSSWLTRFESAVLGSNSVLWNKIVTAQHDSMEAETSAITRDRKIRKLIKKGDASALAVEAAPAFRRLSASSVLTQFHITDLSGQVIFSMPNAYSGPSDMTLVKRVLTEGTVFRGIERDHGELFIELTFPILQRGQVIGTGIFMRSLQSALDDFKFNNNSDVSVINPTGSLEASTNQDLFNSANIELPELGQNSYQEVSVDDKHFGVSIIPLLNPQELPLAHLVNMQDHTESIAAANSISNASYIATLLMLVGVASFFAWYTRRAFAPVEQAVRTLEQISSGDLTMEIATTNSTDEVGRLLQSMASMVTDLRGMISRLVSMSEHLGKSATELRQQADDTKEGVDSQLLETEKVATAMSDMSKTVGEVAQNASSAARLATDASDNATKGQEIVSSSIRSMDSLNQGIQSSADSIRKLHIETNEIGGVIDVIRDIAEQTNLLALNAAIEAARAGEQGRGFAVVADEVRTLAGRTQSSTKDINDMIQRLQNGADNTVEGMNGIIEQMKNSVDTISATEKSLATITESITAITDINLQIAGATEEQSYVAEEINQNVVKINQVTESSSDRVGKTAAASDELSTLTKELSQLVGRFKV